MDVVCERCQAEYEFDDSLISGRGTTVRCTGCGLHFKVFPQDGKAVADIWRVFDPFEPEARIMEFNSMTSLQAAIAAGTVTAAHLLSRASEPPRALSEIVELQPLLGQPKSQAPPPLDENDSEIVVPAQESSVESPSDEGPIVPSFPPEPIHSAGTSAPQPQAESPLFETKSHAKAGAGTKAKIRSALSLASQPASTKKVSPHEAISNTPSPSSSPIATSAHALPPKIDAHFPHQNKGEIFRRELTPTPLGMRAYETVESLPVSSIPGLPARRHARSSGIVLAVLLGGAAFLLFANRSRLVEILETQKPSRDQSQPLPPVEFQNRLDAAEVVWLRRRLLHPKGTVQEETEETLNELLTELTQNEPQATWKRVNLLRTLGRLQEARSLAAKLSPEVGGLYSLALLDLSETAVNPPWPVILERLKEAASGERGLFLARTVYIYSLAASGQTGRATADFEVFSQLHGARTSPLYQDLKAYLRIRQAEHAKIESPP